MARMETTIAKTGPRRGSEGISIDRFADIRQQGKRKSGAVRETQ